MMKKLSVLFLLAFTSLTALPQNYNYYYGDIHTHSKYSDGNKDNILVTPYEDYNFAKNSLHFDFLGISDHNHMLTPTEFHNGLAQADSANEDSNFVCLYGYEWGLYDGGHVLVYGYDSLIGWGNGYYEIYNASSDYTGLFEKIVEKPGAFALLAHPSTSQFGNLVGNSYNTVADEAIVGMPMRNGPAFSTNTTYSETSTGNYYSYFNYLLKRGYHPGINLDHDNHNTTFGRTAQSRMVVLAPALTKNNILEAIRNRRFYGSDDWNVKVDFTLNSNPMGSIIGSDGLPTISISVTDTDANDAVASIKIYSGVSGSGIDPVILTSNTNTSSLTYTDSLASGNKYYYASILQADGDEITTSPIWFEKTMGIEEKENNKINVALIPNPASEEVAITYEIDEPTVVSLELYSTLGNKTTLFLNEMQGKNNYTYQVNIKSLNLNKGFYIARLTVNNAVICRKFIIM